VVDDFDMKITHVIRGDDHINNTPRQINILEALGAPLPAYAHVPMILGHDGERLSKRHGAVSVTQYRDDGYLPEALVNYLARLGWAHGDAEIFSREQFVKWFDLPAVSRSAAKFDPEKLLWLNQQYLKRSSNEFFVDLVHPAQKLSGSFHQIKPVVAALYKDRVRTTNDFIEATRYFYFPVPPSDELRTRYYSIDIKPALEKLRDRFAAIPWEREAIHDALTSTAKEYGLKLGQLAMPLRVMVTGVTETPSIDATLELIDRDEVRARMERELAKFPRE
jgi:glutamyl-tRNA synthetase